MIVCRFFKKKNEVKEIIIILEIRENETGKKPKAVWWDNGSEFSCEHLISYYKRKFKNRNKHISTDKIDAKLSKIRQLIAIHEYSEIILFWH